MMGRHSAVGQYPITVKMPLGKFRLINIIVNLYHIIVADKWLQYALRQ